MHRIEHFFLVAMVLVASAVAPADDRLPASLIRIPESVQTLFIAEVSTARFHRYDRSGDQIIHGGSYYMSIGRQGFGKERAGDKRTPLGVYFVTEQLDTSHLHEKYGVTAFPLDYPNAWDQRVGRDGDGIWVHGVGPGGGQRPAQDTDGCIALPNKDLSLLAPDFRDNVTPVLVMREMDIVDAAERTALRVELEARVAEWADSKASGDLYAYLSLYDDDFKRWGMDKTEWSSFSLQTESLRALRRISVDDLLLLGYPEEDGVYLSRFQQQFVAGGRAGTSTKRLYWLRNSDGVLKIIAEDDG